METKICKECGRRFPVEMFKMTRWGNRAEICNECANKKVRANRQAKKEKAEKEQEAIIKEARMLRLKDFEPRELMQELKRRGYDGQLTFIEKRTVNLSDIEL